MYRSHVLVCGGTGCTSSGSQQIMETLKAEIEKNGLSDEVAVVQTGCHGLCALGPIMIIYPDATFYSMVKVEDIRAPRAFATPHLFGDKNLLPATFTASEDSVLLMATRTSVFKLISSVPDLLHRFLCVTGNCNKCTVTRLRILSYKMLRSRLVYYFMEHKISPDTALLEHNQVQLAEYLGVTRPALSKEINKMMKEGLISINKKVVTLEDMAALKEYI